MDDRLIHRLEEQLRDAHATNGELRERLLAQEKDEQKARSIRSEFETVQGALAKAHAERKAAENAAAAALRKQKEAEREASHLREDNEQLQEKLTLAREQLDQLNELNMKIEAAKEVADLFTS